MKLTMLFLLSCAGTAALGVPHIVDGSIAVSQEGGVLKATYALEGGPAIVTADIRTNGVTIGARNFTGISGDVNRLVSTNAATILWRMENDWPDGRAAAGTLEVSLTAWSPSTPPDYLVADLAVTNSVKYYVSTNALPRGGLTNDIYRTSHLVMRRIPAKGVVWRMGQQRSGYHTGLGYDAAIPHYVRLTQDYWMSIYELTQSQYQHATLNGNPSTFKGPMQPLETISPYTFRGVTDFHQDVAAGSPCGKLRAKTGLALDMPWDAQGEYACRAGTGTINYVDDRNDNGTLLTLGWNRGNRTAEVTVDVGKYRPNAWGLYDMYGNLWETTRDFYSYGTDYIGTFAAGFESDATVVTEDPRGPATAKTFSSGYGTIVQRGGSWSDWSNQGVSANRSSMNPSYAGKWHGFRLVAPIE